MTGIFEKQLKEEGMASTRVLSVAMALDQLHRALGRCDMQNLRLFFTKPLLERLGAAAVADGGVVDFRELVAYKPQVTADTKEERS